MIERFYKNNQGLIWLLSGAIFLVVWFLGNFANANDVDRKINDIKAYVDAKDSNVNNRLDSMERVINRIDRNVFELAKGRK